VWPPLEGPGVPPERVDAVSSWSLFQEGCGAKKKKLKPETEKKHPVRLLLGKRYPCPDPQEKTGKYTPPNYSFFPGSQIVTPQRKYLIDSGICLPSK